MGFGIASSFRTRSLRDAPLLVPRMNLVPNDETSAYSTLLLHTPWSNDGEAQLVNENTTAVDILANSIQLSQLPEYVVPTLVRQAASTFRTTNQTIPQQQTHDDDIQHDRSDDNDIILPHTSTNDDIGMSLTHNHPINTNEVRDNIPSNLHT
jgi:hypothetical protein